MHGNKAARLSKDEPFGTKDLPYNLAIPFELLGSNPNLLNKLSSIFKSRNVPIMEAFKRYGPTGHSQGFSILVFEREDMRLVEVADTSSTDFCFLMNMRGTEHLHGKDVVVGITWVEK